MTHIEQGELQAYLDHEVRSSTRAGIDAHLHGCAVCAAELERLRSASSLFANALRASDVAPPRITVQTREYQTQATVGFSRRALARAAMMVIGFAALASATIPGSPVRSWISEALRSVGVLPATETAQPTAVVNPHPVPAPNGESAALSIEPVNGRVRVILTNVASDAVVTVRLVDGDRAVVQATGAAAQARFNTGPGRIEVVGIGKGEVFVDVPRSAQDARVEADGRVLFSTKN